jgi:MFS family permease
MNRKQQRGSWGRNRALPVGLGLLFLFASGYMHQPVANCPTPRSRLDLLHALAAGRLNVDAYRNTSDLAEFQGHFYSDKAPGTVVLALPAFAASTLALRVLGKALDSDSGWLVSSWIACVGSIGIIAAAGAGLLFAWLSRYAGAKSALVTTLAVFLGAAPLPYATMMFSHALVVGLVAVALWAAARQQECGMWGPEGGLRNSERTLRSAPCGTLDPGGQHGKERCGLPVAASGWRRWAKVNRWDLLAGFACGWALASEYTAGIVLGGLLLFLASQAWRRAIAFCLAALPPLLLIPLYSWACFRSPFLLPYSLNASFPQMKEGLYAIKWPDPQTAFNLLFSPARGLFFWTPFLIMAWAGYAKLLHSDRRLFWLTYAVPLFHIIVISGRRWDWPAGPTLGPRYLAPILPLLALPCALGVQRFPRIGMALAAYSVLITTLATLTNAAPPFSYNPLVELHVPLLLKGELAPNLGTVCGLPPWLSVVVYYAILCGGIWWLWRRLPAEPAPTVVSDRAADNPVADAA